MTKIKKTINTAEVEHAIDWVMRYNQEVSGQETDDVFDERNQAEC